MRALTAPTFASYRSAWASTGLPFRMHKDGAYVFIELSTGGADFAKAHTYDVAFRSADRRMAVHESDTGDRFTAEVRILNPTWDGAYDILRYGLGGRPANVDALPTPEPSPGSDVAVIGSVKAISAAYYHVEDRGLATCPTGARGRRLSLRAYRDPQSHPLTDVTIDPATDRFCSMRFRLRQPGLIGATGDYELHFAQIGAYWLISSGTIDVSVRILGIAARHTVLTWVNSDIDTPADIESSTFDDPTPR